MLATKILGEPFFKADIFGMLSVITGSVLAVIFGPRTAGMSPFIFTLCGLMIVLSMIYAIFHAFFFVLCFVMNFKKEEKQQCRIWQIGGVMQDFFYSL